MMAPSAFLQRPMRWLRAVSDWRAHTSGAPDFAYDLCMSAAADDPCEGLDLSSWQVAFNGAEPVRPATMRAFAARFAAHGFRPEAFMACYGLAESTLMVTGSRKGAAPRTMPLSKRALDAGRIEPGADVEVAACGDAVEGASVRIVGPDGALQPDGVVGEIVVRSESVCSGYWGRAADSLWTRVGDAPHLRTGDLGAIVGGELVIVGRLKDVIIVHGRNIHPADIEVAAEAAPGVARALACGAPGARSEEILLFAEVERAALRRLDADALVAAIRAAGVGAAEAAIAGVVLVKPGALPLTSSGKRRRGACRDLFLSGALAGIVHADTGAQLLADALAGRAAAG